MDDNGHGTHLAGIVGGTCAAANGICGVSPKVSIMACKFLDQEGHGVTSDAVR